MSAYTPGPWEVFVPDGVGATFGIESVCGNAVVWFGSTSHDGITRIEDARLIAAAPDGLIAGTDLLDVVKAAIRAGDWKVDGACDPDAAIRRMEQFIAKATGEQS